MRTILLPAIAVLALFISSCSRYQMSVLNSTNSVKDEQTGDFKFENDSVRILYSFYGKNAPISIQVLNKLDKPLYLDWQRSAVIVDNEAFSYATNQVNIEGNVNTSTTTLRNGRRSIFGDLSSTSGTISATADLPKNVTFLPPHAQISNVPLALNKGYIELPDSAFHKEKIDAFDTMGQMKIDVKTATFAKENSPLAFKSYLTLYAQEGNEMKPVAYQHDFYVSKVVNSMTDPKTFNFKRGDYFLNSKTTGYGKVMTGVGVATVVVGGAAIAASTTDEVRK